jgi:hypothetical protein
MVKPNEPMLKNIVPDFGLELPDLLLQLDGSLRKLGLILTTCKSKS